MANRVGRSEAEGPENGVVRLGLMQGVRVAEPYSLYARPEATQQKA